MSSYRACNRCGNTVASTSRMCPYCGRNPYGAGKWATIIVLIIIGLWLVANW